MVHYFKHYKIQVNSNECYTFPKRKLILSPSVLQSVKLYRVHNGLKSFLELPSDFCSLSVSEVFGCHIDATRWLMALNFESVVTD